MDLYEIPQDIINLVREEKYAGPMKDPDGKASIKGLCGDEMIFWLTIEEDILKDIKFETSGCFFSAACGAMTAGYAYGKKIREALGISPGDIIDMLKCLPDDHCHCAILSVGTLHKAIADYWLRGKEVKRWR